MTEQPGAADPFEVPDGTSPPRSPSPTPGVAGDSGGTYPPAPYPQVAYPPPGYPPPAYGAPTYPVPAYGAPPWAYGPPGGPTPSAPLVPAPGPRPRRGVPAYDEAQPYHRVLRTRNYRWWRPLVGLLVATVTFLVLSVVVTIVTLLPAFLSGSIDLDALETDPAGALVSDPLGLLGINLSLAVFIPAAILGLLAGHQLRPGWLHSVLGRMRWRFLLACLGLEVLISLVVFPLSALVGEGVAGGEDVVQLSFAEWLPFAVVILLTTPLQAAGEEYAFRGYGLQALGAWVRNPWFGIVVTSLLFAAAHGAQSPALFLNRFAFGMVAGFLTVRTGGLEAAIGIHVVNNLVVLLLASAAGQLAPSLTPSEAPWGVALLDVGGMVAYGLAALWLARRMGLDTMTRPSPPPPQWVQPQYVGSFGQPPGPR